MHGCSTEQQKYRHLHHSLYNVTVKTAQQFDIQYNEHNSLKMSTLFEAIRHEMLSLAHRPCNPAPDYSFAECVQTRIMERAGCVPHWTRSTIYTLSTHYLQHCLYSIYTLSTHYLHTIYTLSTHYLHTIYTLSTHFLHAIYTLSTNYLHII